MATLEHAGLYNYDCLYQFPGVCQLSSGLPLLVNPISLSAPESLNYRGNSDLLNMVATFSPMSPVLESNERLPGLFGRKILGWGALLRRGLTTIAGFGKSKNTVRGIFISF